MLIIGIFKIEIYFSRPLQRLISALQNFNVNFQKCRILNDHHIMDNVFGIRFFSKNLMPGNLVSTIYSYYEKVK